MYPWLDMALGTSFPTYAFMLCKIFFVHNAVLVICVYRPSCFFWLQSEGVSGPLWSTVYSEPFSSARPDPSIELWNVSTKVSTFTWGFCVCFQKWWRRWKLWLTWTLNWQWRRETCCPWPTRMWSAPGEPPGGSSAAWSRRPRAVARVRKPRWNSAGITGKLYVLLDACVVTMAATPTASFRCYQRGRHIVQGDCVWKLAVVCY